MQYWWAIPLCMFLAGIALHIRGMLGDFGDWLENSVFGWGLWLGALFLTIGHFL